MDIKYNRERNLPAFLIDLADLEILLDKLAFQFDGNESVSIGVEMKHQKLSFKSVDEIKSYKGLPDTIADFNIYISDKETYSKRCHLYASGFLGTPPSIGAQSDNEAWCAGVVDVAYQFFETKKVWYSFFRGWPLFVFAIFVFPYLPTAITFVAPVMGWSIDISPKMGITYFTVTLLLALLALFQKKILPASSLVVRETSNFIHRYSTELMLIIALLGLIVAIVGLFK